MQLSAQDRFRAWDFVCVSNRERHRFCHLNGSLSDKSCEQLLMTFQDGQKKEEKKRKATLCKVPESSLKHTSWPGRCQPTEKTPLWYLSNCDDITSSPHSRGQQMVCVICYLPQVLSKTSSASQKMLWWKMNRWTHEGGNKSEGGFFQMYPWQRHLPGRMRLFYLFY